MYKDIKMMEMNGDMKMLDEKKHTEVFKGTSKQEYLEIHVLVIK